jgi:hypothetical protein
MMHCILREQSVKRRRDATRVIHVHVVARVARRQLPRVTWHIFSLFASVTLFVPWGSCRLPKLHLTCRYGKHVGIPR